MTGNEATTKGTRNDDGFTLVEMLVGLSITALIASLLVAALVQLRPLRTITQTTEAEAELTSVSVYLVDLLSGARQLALLDNDPNRKIVFEGNAQRIRFVAVSRTGNLRSSLRDVELSVRQTGDRLDLVQQNTRRRLFTEPPVDTFVVAADLDTVRFQYLDRAGDAEGGRWLDEWSDAQAPPRAVQVTLSFTRFGRKLSIHSIAVLGSAR